jgi:dihydrofolate reductase
MAKPVYVAILSLDETHLMITPIIVGGGNQALPDDIRLQLELEGERTFANGVVHVHYRTKVEP